MGNQLTFASMAWNGKGKVTRRERFLAEMDAVIPWPRLVGLIEPHYPKAGNGRQPLGLEKMLRIYFLHRIRWRGIFQCGRVLSAERNHRVRWNDIARAIRRPHRACHEANLRRHVHGKCRSGRGNRCDWQRLDGG